MIELSICIVNWNTSTYLKECLLSIAEFPPTATYEIIVVDNASTDGSSEMLEQDFPDVRKILNTQNVGYAAGNNQALEIATGTFLLLLNPDVHVLANTLDDALKLARELPEFGALGVKQIGVDGKVQKSVRSFPRPNGVFWELIGLSRIAPKSKLFGTYRMTWFDYKGTVEVDQPMATFLLTTRAVYEQVGGLDEAFPIFFNDVDWCLRIKKSGRRIYYTDQAQIFHYGGAGTGKEKRSTMAIESKRSFLKFYEKHYKKTVPGFVYNAICVAVKISIARTKETES